MRKIFVFGFVCSAVLLASCSKEQAGPKGELEIEDCATIPASFSNDVIPIFEANCALSGCHLGATPTAGVVMTNHSQVSGLAESGRLLSAIKHEGDFLMPLGSPQLDQTDIDIIECWILNGAADD